MNVKEIVYSCINKVVFVDDIEESNDLKEDLGLESLSLVSVIVEIEDSCNILFDDADLDPAGITSVYDLLKLTEKYV